MSTFGSTNHIMIECAHLENLIRQAPEFFEREDFNLYHLRKQSLKGMTQVSTISEQVVAFVGGFAWLSSTGVDGSDGSDTKLVTVRHHSNRSKYSANVAKIKTKIGNLRIQCWDRYQNIFYYFVIPHAAYVGKNSIEIPFLRNTGPSRFTTGDTNWWDYEVESFYEMCAYGVDGRHVTPKRNSTLAAFLR